MQFHLRPVQVRIHERRLLHQLHQRRQGLLCDDSSLLQLPVAMLRKRLLLLYLLQQHAGLLRHFRLIEAGDRLLSPADRLAGAGKLKIRNPGRSAGCPLISPGFFIAVVCGFLRSDVAQ